MQYTKPLSVPPKKLAASITSASTSFTINNIESWLSGTDITVSDFGSKAYVAFVNATRTAIEFMEIDPSTIADTSIDILARGLGYDGNITEDDSRKLDWTAGTTTILFGTDLPQVFMQYGRLAFDETVTGYWKVPDPVSATDIANKQWVLSQVNGGDVSFEKVVVSGNAGETVSAGMPLYFKTTDQEWYKTDGANVDMSDPTVLLGIAQGAGTNGNAITGGILLVGLDTNQSGLTPGSKYYIQNTVGTLGTSPGTYQVLIGVAKSATELFVTPRADALTTADEKDALAGGGDFGTPSSTNKFLTEDSINSSTIFTNPVRRTYTTTDTVLGSATTQFDITNTSGSTYRYTYDSTGTDPGITSITVPTGSGVTLQGQNFNSANQGAFIVTGSGTDYFEITNASGVAETNKTLGTGYISTTSTVWTKPDGLKYIEVELQAPGASGEEASSSQNEIGAGGGSGAYSRKLILASALGTTEAVSVGANNTSASFASNKSSRFGTHLSATGGKMSMGGGGVATGGDLNIDGQPGLIGKESATSADLFGIGRGANSILGIGGSNIFPGDGSDYTGVNGTGYGSGGSGGVNTNNTPNPTAGGLGAQGIVIITEYYK